MKLRYLVALAAATLAIPATASADNAHCVRHSGNDANSGLVIYCSPTVSTGWWQTLTHGALAFGPVEAEADAPYSEAVPAMNTSELMPTRAADRITATGTWRVDGGIIERVDFASCPVIEHGGPTSPRYNLGIELPPWIVQGRGGPYPVELRESFAATQFLGDTFPAGCVAQMEHEQHEYKTVCELEWGSENPYGRPQGLEAGSGCGPNFTPHTEPISFIIGPARYHG